MSDIPILTPAMAVTAKVNTPQSCVMHFPCDEGSGNDITDITGGVIVTDNATAEHNVNPHAIQFTASSLITSGDIPELPAGKSLVIIDVMIPGTLGSAGANNLLGATGANSSAYGLTGSMTIDKEVSVVVSFQTLTAGAKFVRVGTFNGETGEINAYSGKNGATTALDNTGGDIALVDGESLIPNSNGIPNNYTLGDTALNDASFYGMAFYMVDTLPDVATILEAADWAYANWTQGKKVLPPQFADLN